MPLIRREVSESRLPNTGIASRNSQATPGIYRPRPNAIARSSHHITERLFDRLIKIKQAITTIGQINMMLGVAVREATIAHGVAIKINAAKTATVCPNQLL